MECKKIEYKKGINLQLINTNKFKTNLIAIFLITPITRKYVTYDAILSAILRRGSKNMKTQEDISITLEEMYGATFDSGIDKTGDNHILKFYLESLNDEFIPQNNINILKESINKLSEIVFNPLTENGVFSEEYLKQEKENMEQIINSKTDNKALYAKCRCIEEMYKGEPAGLSKHGYIEDLSEITAENLYEYYQKLINECKINIFISGNLENVNCTEILDNDENIINIKPRNPNFIINSIQKKDSSIKEKVITESKEVTQGKLVIGLDLNLDEKDLQNPNIHYEAMLYNAILRRNSKL